jgi:[ribosomal protein S5]-alanine N-acetyltransferase
MDDYPVLHTTRLTLRQFSLNDATDVRRLADNKLIADTTSNIPYPYLDGMAEQWIASHQSQYESGEGLNLAVVDKDIGFIGAMCLMNISSDLQSGELGYWIGEPYWSQGYATEAARAVLQCGFKQLGLNRLYAQHFSRNPASGRVLQKIGMQREGLLRQHAKKWQELEDVVIYGILQSEFRATQE